jgi:acetyl-CoA carboxylase biotin carboxylase subunit
VGGIKTNLPLFRRIVQDKNFVAGDVDTGYLGRMLAEHGLRSSTDNHQVAMLAAALFQLQTEQSHKEVVGPGDYGKGRWKRASRTEALS